MSAGSLHTCAVKTDGSLWCWGQNTTNGRLGLGDTVSRSVPTQVGTGTDWGQVMAAGLDTCAIRATRAMSCWGGNNYGELGVGDTTRRTSPVALTGKWAGMSVGFGMVFGLPWSG